MIKDQEYLSEKASYCLDIAKKLGATDSSVIVVNSISETVNFRNQKLDESNRSDNLGINLTTYIGKKKSSISSSNLLKENLDTLIEKSIETTKNTPEDEYNSLPDKDLLAKEVKDLDLYDDTHMKNENKIKSQLQRTVNVYDVKKFIQSDSMHLDGGCEDDEYEEENNNENVMTNVTDICNNNIKQKQKKQKKKIKSYYPNVVLQQTLLMFSRAKKKDIPAALEDAIKNILTNEKIVLYY